MPHIRSDHPSRDRYHHRIAQEPFGATRNSEARVNISATLHFPHNRATTMSTATNANESYCTFTLAGDMTAGGLPSEADIRKDLENNDPKVSHLMLCGTARIP